MNFLDEDKIKYIKWGLLFFVFFSLMSINCYQVYLLSREEDNNDIILENEVKEEVVAEKKDEVIEKVKVDIKGAIKKPGVYELDSNSIINDVIKLAGGLKTNASTKYLNLSKKILDEMVINIYTESEVKKMKEPVDVCEVKDQDLTHCDDATIIVTNPDSNKDISNSNEVVDNKVSINNGTKEELMTLSGIGEVKAQAIIDYRNKNGKFSKIEDLMNVSGIGESTYNQIKDNIKL